MTQLNAPATPMTKGFSAPVLGLIEHAQRLNKWSIYLVYLAIALFLFCLLYTSDAADE